MKFDCLLPCSQNSAIAHYPEPVWSSPNPCIMFLSFHPHQVVYLRNGFFSLYVRFSCSPCILNAPQISSSVQLDTNNTTWLLTCNPSAPLKETTPTSGFDTCIRTTMLLFETITGDRLFCFYYGLTVFKQSWEYPQCLFSFVCNVGWYVSSGEKW